MARNFSLAVC